MQTEEWFLEAQPGAWIKLNDKNNQPHWCHPEGRCFCASVEPWLIECDTNIGAPPVGMTSGQINQTDSVSSGGQALWSDPTRLEQLEATLALEELEDGKMILQ